MKTNIISIVAAVALSISASTAFANAPDITVSGNTLFWNASRAQSINVHYGNGEWIETIPGTALSWQAPVAGEYFLVLTDSGHWSDWPKSRTVSVGDVSDTDSDSITTNKVIVVNAPASLKGSVYGETTAEIIWQGVASENTFQHYQVYLDDQLVHTTTGHSYFINNLQPGTQYSFYVDALRLDGTTTIGKRETITTAGNKQDTSSTTTNNQTTNNVNIVNAPSSLDSAVYGETAAELLWPGVADENTFIGYQVYRNNELVETTTGHSYFMQDLQPGTRYDFYVDALRLDGTTTIGKSHSITTAGNNQNTNSTTTNTQTTNSITVVNSPLSLDSAVYGETAAELFWPGSASENTFVGYQVYRNDELVETTTGHSYFMQDLQPGTRYDFYVDALRLDGTVTIGFNHGFTTFGTSAASSFGKPAVDLGTHGFETWNQLSDSGQALFPSDCLFAPRDVQGGLCFSPASRELRSVRADNLEDAVLEWTATLPGDNQSNRVEALEWYAGTKFLALSDTTTFFTQPSFEINRFNADGQVIDTLPILDSFSGTGDNSTKLINIDGKDLIVMSGDYYGAFGGVDATYETRIFGEYYEAIEGSDPSQISGWKNKGALVANIDGSTGETVDITFISGLSAEQAQEQNSTIKRKSRN